MLTFSPRGTDGERLLPAEYHAWFPLLKTHGGRPKSQFSVSRGRKPALLAYSSTLHTLVLVDLSSPQSSAQIVKMLHKGMLLGVYPVLSILSE